MVNLLGFPVYYFKAQKALQWWQERQSMQLLNETERIRNDLLQKSFIIRRSLENFLVGNNGTLTEASLDWLKKIEEFYGSLEGLSERLLPAYVEESFSLAVRDMVQSLSVNSSKLKIEMDLPDDWRQESLERSFIILKVLEELLRITSSYLSEESEELVIQIILRQDEQISEFIVDIFCSNTSSLDSYCNLKHLEYLSETFEFLTSGECARQQAEQQVSWHFKWLS